MGCVPLKIPAIQEQIKTIEKAWQFFYRDIQKIAKGEDSDGKALAYVIDNNEQLLKLSDELVKRFENANRSKKLSR